MLTTLLSRSTATFFGTCLATSSGTSSTLDSPGRIT
jgi:hypothetical protein